MADIDVQRRRPSIWPWIIGLVVLALLIWVLTEMLGDDEPELPTEAPPVSSLETPSAPPRAG